MKPMGRLGFNSAEEAEADARRCLMGIGFAIWKRGSVSWDALRADDYAWTVPVSYVVGGSDTKIGEYR